MNIYESCFGVRKRVGKRLMEMIKDKGFTKMDLAKEAGISRPTLNHLIDGNINNIANFEKHLEKLCAILDVKPEELLVEKQEKIFQRMPVGVDDFEKLIEFGYYYVDKTLLIKELLDMGGEVNLITRPRRFGKSLNMSMLKYFFEGGNIDSATLFAGTKIMAQENEKYQSHMGKYKVIFLTLKSLKQPEFKSAYYCLREEIAREYSRHDALLSELKKEEDRERYLQIRAMKAEPEEYKTAILFLSQCLYEVYGKKVVVLIDEYDVPLENAYFQGFYDEMIPLIRSMFESALKSNACLAFSVITGCLRISKESIFTGLNNLKVISVTSSIYAEHFGFTQEEVDQMLNDYDIVEKRDVVKRWYDGYKFGETEVYNPWSVVNYVSVNCRFKNAFPEPYWSNTSSNSIVRSLVECADMMAKREIEDLLDGKSIVKQIHEDVTYEDMNSTQENLWNFLFFTGYLKKVSEMQVDEKRYMEMAIPNLEVKYIYRRMVTNWFTEQVQKKDLSVLYEAIVTGNAPEVEKELTLCLRESISFHDNKEAFYHGFLLGLLYRLDLYLADSNREAGDGRYDICLKSLDEEQPVIMIELKQAATYAELETKAQEALAQIHTKNYKDALIQDGYREVLCYGIGFMKKRCKVVVERVEI